MEELEELLQQFRNWNEVWYQYQNGLDKFNIKHNIKPTSKDLFLSVLVKKYKVIKIKNNE